jgi:hypothetical protein
MENFHQIEVVLSHIDRTPDQLSLDRIKQAPQRKRQRFFCSSQKFGICPAL